MQARKIFLARHAKPYSPDNERRFLGQTDVPLSNEGVEQAEDLARDLSKHPVSAIYSSDLMRARQTGELVAAKFGLKVMTDKRLREIDMGEWEYLTFTELQRKFPGEFEKRGKDTARYRPPSGESFEDVRERAMPAFGEIALSSSAGDIVIVAHAGVNRVILCELMSVPIDDLFSIKVDYASAYELIVKDNKITFTGEIIKNGFQNL